VTSRELSIAPGRTLATMFLTISDMADVDTDDRPSDIRSDALMMTPVDAGDDRGTVAYLPTDISLAEECDVSTADDMSSLSELVHRDNDGGHSDREPARQ